MKTINDFWKWTINVLAYGLRVNTWYNKQPSKGLHGYLNDFSSRIFGYATLRQLRVKNGINKY